MNDDRYNELEHSGVKGMRWGIRRYQNQDGSLTPEGRKRRSIGSTYKTYRRNKKRKEALKKARETRAANKIAAEQRAKDIKKGKIKPKDMTIEELNQRIARLQLEKSYTDAVRNQKQNYAGQRFASKFKDSLVDKMADNVAADLLNQIAKALGADFINKVYGKTKVVKDEANSTKDNPVYKTIIDEVVFTNNKK